MQFPLSGLSVSIVGWVVVFMFCAAAGCGGSQGALTDAEWAKLDPTLRGVFDDDAPRSDVAIEQGDGTVVYPVVVRTDAPDALREAGLPLGTVLDRVVTARWTREQLRTALRLDEVVKVSSSRTEPTAPLNTPD